MYHRMTRSLPASDKLFTFCIMNGRTSGVTLRYRRYFCMIHYRKILELHDEGISLRGIAASTGHSRQKVTEALAQAEKKGLVCPLDDEMTDKWIEEFLFPEKSLEASGRQPLDLEYIHEELAKPNVTLSLLQHEYEAKCRENQKIPYSYRSFLRHYSSYADKYKATLRIRRKPGEIMEVDWAKCKALHLAQYVKLN